MEQIIYSTKNYTQIPKKNYGTAIDEPPPPPPTTPTHVEYEENFDYEEQPQEIPQSLRNHALPPTFGGNADDTLNKLRAQPISGYSAPTRIKPSNNRGGTYSRYVDRPGDSKINPYQSVGSQHVAKIEFNKAYGIKPCLLCSYPLDQCRCAMAQNSRK